MTQYALFQHSVANLDIDAVAVAFDAVPELMRADARMMVRRAHGVLAERLSHADAKALHESLAAHHQRVEIVPQAWLGLPQPVLCSRIVMARRKLVLSDGHRPGQEIRWQQILAFAVGRIQKMEQVRVGGGGSVMDRLASAGTWSSWHAGGLASSMDAAQVEYQTKAHSQVLLDIVADTRIGVDLTDGAAGRRHRAMRFRILLERFDYSCLGKKRGHSAWLNFPLLVRALCHRAPNAVQSRGVANLSRHASDLLLYPGIREIERELAWEIWRHAGPGVEIIDSAGGPYRNGAMGIPRVHVPLLDGAAKAQAPDGDLSTAHEAKNVLDRPRYLATGRHAARAADSGGGHRRQMRPSPHAHQVAAHGSAQGNDIVRTEDGDLSQKEADRQMASDIAMSAALTFVVSAGGALLLGPAGWLLAIWVAPIAWRSRHRIGRYLRQRSAR